MRVFKEPLSPLMRMRFIILITGILVVALPKLQIASGIVFVDVIRSIFAAFCFLILTASFLSSFIRAQNEKFVLLNFLLVNLICFIELQTNNFSFQMSVIYFFAYFLCAIALLNHLHNILFSVFSLLLIYGSDYQLNNPRVTNLLVWIGVGFVVSWYVIFERLRLFQSLSGSSVDLEKSERRFRRMAENFPGAVFAGTSDVDKRFQFKYFSTSIWNLIGVNSADLIEGRAKFHDHIDLDDKTNFENNFIHALKNQSTMNWQGRLKRKNSETIWVNMILKPTAMPDGTTEWDGVIIDETIAMSAQQQLESERAKSAYASKLSTLGEMSSGIAHEINNPLAIIGAATTVLKRLVTTQPLDPVAIDKKVETILKTVERISKIVKALRTFAREGDHDPFERILVRNIVNETLELCQARFVNHGIDLRRQDIDVALNLECRPTQVGQVLLNLMNNSFDAVYGTDKAWVEIGAKKQDDFIHFYVIDSGQGIPKKIAHKIMDPFFTTKEPGKGTGLGLSISMGIARQHNGTLTIDNESDHTKFVLAIPIHQQKKNLDLLRA